VRHLVTLAWVSLIGAGIGGAIALTACAGAHLGWWDYNSGLRILIPGVGVGAVGLAAGLAWLGWALWMNTAVGGRIAGIGLAGSLLLVGIPLHNLWLEYSLPRLHDVSTDIGDPPQFHALLAKRKGAPNPPEYDGPRVIVFHGASMTTAVAQKYAWLNIKSLEQLAGTVPQKEWVKKFYWRSLNAVNALDWQVAGFDLAEGRIEATSTSFWFGVKSDIVIRVRPAGAIGVRVDIRAKSRIGEHDHGRNAGLIGDFLAKVRST
jgi:hypothetical protein